MNLLEHFILHFMMQAHDLIKTADRYKLWLPKQIREKPPIMLNKIYLNDLCEEFIKNTPVDKLYIDSNFGEIVLSRSELLCIKGLLQGKTAKEIGQSIQKSFRTVERHLEDVRLKLSCHSRSEILSTLFEENHRLSLSEIDGLI